MEKPVTALVAALSDDELVGLLVAEGPRLTRRVVDEFLRRGAGLARRS